MLRAGPSEWCPIQPAAGNPIERQTEFEMQIEALDTAHLDAVVALYRSATRNVPHCRFAPSAQALTDVLRCVTPEHGSFHVAVEAGAPQGFVTLRDRGKTVDGRRTAAVTGLFVDHDRAGRLLLDAAMAWAQARGVQTLLAFPPTHFHCLISGYNGGWDGLSDRVDVAAHVLARHGFTPFHRELHLECAGASYPPEPVTAPPALSVVRRIEAHWQVVVATLDDGREVGSCEYSPVSRISDDPAAAKWGYIWNLDVVTDAQRRGIGRYLVSCAIADLSMQGCHGCWLTTGATNWPAQALYFALGFTVADGSTSFRKKL
jgi:ribosomal protein S18 acetylase RimI-like enzyme